MVRFVLEMSRSGALSGTENRQEQPGSFSRFPLSGLGLIEGPSSSLVRASGWSCKGPGLAPPGSRAHCSLRIVSCNVWPPFIVAHPVVIIPVGV